MHINQISQVLYNFIQLYQIVYSSDLIAVELETELDQIEENAGAVHNTKTSISNSLNTHVDLNLK